VALGVGLLLSARGGELPQAVSEYVAGLEGERREGGEFLLEHLPAQDREGLSLELFRENLEEAFVARETYPWARALPRERFFNEVLPHAVANETRDSWRPKLRAMFHPHVEDCGTVREAAAAVAARIGELGGVKYDTGREKACQSPAESIRQGKASCTGLSILMLDALRAVGVPTRLAGIPLWGTREGNHTWIEIHDGEDWQMADYASPPKSWNKGWAIDRCAYCDPLAPVHGVFASSYRPTGIVFPMVWDWDLSGRPSGNGELYEEKRDGEGMLVSLNWKVQASKVPGIDRTRHYIGLAGGRKLPIPKGMGCVSVKVWLEGGERRVDVPVRLRRGGELLFEGRSASEGQDLNDYVRVPCDPGELEVEYRLADGSWTTVAATAVADQETPVTIELSEEEAAGFLDPGQRRELSEWFRDPDQPWPGGEGWPSLDGAAAVDRARAELHSIRREAARHGESAKALGPLPPTLDALKRRAGGDRAGLSPAMLHLGEFRMPFVAIRKESKPVPKSGRALFICLHGGGGNGQAEGPHAWPVNTREWQSQLALAAEVYHGEGVFFVPRMADDRIGRWWKAHVQDALDQVVEHGIREWGVDPNRVFLMGISEGCYGTQILSPFLADRLAAGNAMAGGVSEDVPLENLRHVAFRTDVGENDTTFNRVGLARRYHARLDELAEQGGYVNELNVQAGRGHGIDYEPGSRWMIGHRREPRPERVTWTSKRLDGRRRAAFYWLGLDGPEFDGALELDARLERAANRVVVDAGMKGGGGWPEGQVLRVFLDDSMLDLAKPVEVVVHGRTVSKAHPQRSLETLARTLAGRGDPELSFPVEIRLEP